MMIYEQYFDGRKPSENQVINAIKRGLSKGFSQFEIAWGENMVTLEKGRSGVNQWIGWGWIKNISGSDLADQFNREGI
jgi:hypothetical protein